MPYENNSSPYSDNELENKLRAIEASGSTLTGKDGDVITVRFAGGERSVCCLK